MKKLHPADARDREAIARATGFHAFIRVAPDEVYSSQHATLAAAREKADFYNRSFGVFGRRALVYALVDGREVPVPNDY